MTTAPVAAAAPWTYPRIPPEPAYLPMLLGWVTRHQWAIFPCHSVKQTTGGQWVCTCKKGAACTEPGKHPLWNQDDLPHGHNSASSDPDQIRTWARRWPWANWARRPGPNEFVLDIDAKPDKDGRPWLAEHRALIPATLTARRGDGQHLHLVAPPGTPLPQNASKIAPGVDIRTHSGYIMIPPSRHVSGMTYGWEPGTGPEDRAPALATWDLLLEVTQSKPTAPTPQDAVSPAAPPDPGDRWSIADLVKEARDKHPNARHDGGLYLACQLRDEGYTEGEAEGGMRDYHRLCPAGDHPYPWSDPAQALSDAYRTPARAPRQRKRPAPPTPPPMPQDAAPPRDTSIPIPEGDKDELIAALQAQLLAAVARAEAAETRLAERNRDFLWLAHTLKNRAIPNGPKITMIGSYFEIKGQQANGARPAPAYNLKGKKPDKPLADGLPASVSHVADSTGQDTDTVSRHFRVLAEAGAWDHGWVTIPCENAPPQTQVQLAPKPAFFEAPHLLKLPEGTPKHGGHHPKKEPCENATCGPDTVETEVHLVKVEIDRCQTCEEVQGAPRITGDVEIIQLIRESAPTEAPMPQDAARRSKRRIAQTPLVPALARTAATVRELEQAEAHDPETRADEIRPLDGIGGYVQGTVKPPCPDCGPFGCVCWRSAKEIVVPPSPPDRTPAYAA